MEYWLILVLTFFGSVLFTIGIFIYLAVRGRGRGNIRYFIVQTYAGVRRPIERKGNVTLQDTENLAVFEMFDRGEKVQLGIFQQKHLIPAGKGYWMFLEQFEIGRYRPLEFSDELKTDEIETFKRDFLGNVALDKDNKPIKSTIKELSRLFKPVPNDDVNFVLGSRTRLKEKLLARQKQKSFWRMLAVVSIYIFLFLSIFINSYYNHETSKRLAATVESQSEAKVAEMVTTTIMRVLANQTATRDVVKQLPIDNGG